MIGYLTFRYTLRTLSDDSSLRIYLTVSRFRVPLDIPIDYPITVYLVHFLSSFQYSCSIRREAIIQASSHGHIRPITESGYTAVVGFSPSVDSHFSRLFAVSFITLVTVIRSHKFVVSGGRHGNEGIGLYAPEKSR